MATEAQKKIIARILKDMGEQPRGRRPDWKGWRSNAFAITSQLGYNFTPRCQSCDADVYDVLLDAVK